MTLVAMAARSTELPEPRELDMLLTAGERISMSLLAIALNARGCRAASYTGSQAGIITDTQHGAAKIAEIRPKRIQEALAAGNVVILAGFQGLSSDYEITTLGRGGSDLTAVAMAGAVEAAVCEIYTDVDGIYTAIRASSRAPGGSTSSPTTRCSSSRRRARGCCSRGRSRWLAAWACRCTCAPRSRSTTGPG